MARDFGQRQLAAGDSNADVEIVAALGGLGRQRGDVNGDFDRGMVLPQPLDRGLEVGVAGDDDD